MPPEKHDRDEGAGGRRRGHQAEAERPDVEDVEGEDREERRRHAEDHGVEVDDEGRQDEPASADEAEALADGLEPGVSRQPASGGMGRIRRSISERRTERDDVGRVGAGQADRSDEQAGRDRPDDRRGVEGQLAEGDRRPQPLGRDQPRRGRGPGRLVDRRQPRGEERDREQDRQRRLRLERQDDEPRLMHGQAELGDEQEPAPIERIGDGPAAEREQQDRERAGRA